MSKLDQRDTCGLGEFGVQAQHLDREGNFIDNALPSAMLAVEQFEVFDSVVGSGSVSVVDSLFSAQFASEVLFHDVAVFQDRVFSSRNSRRNGQPYVAVSCFDVPGGAFFVESLQSFVALVLGFAFAVAEFLLRVNASARLASAVLYFSALKALEPIASVGTLFSSGVRARHRAVQRVSVEFLSVRREVRLHHGERISTFPTSEGNGGSAFGWQVQLESVFASALKSAEHLFRAGIRVKRLLAIQTHLLDRHGYAPLFGNDGVALSLGIVK